MKKQSSVEFNWEEKARGIIQAELKRRNINYIELAERLETLGIEETPANLSNKIRRGRFSFAFACQVFYVIGLKNLHMEE